VKKITISDMTLTEYSATLSFKEKIEIARCLNSLNVDVIYMPKIENAKADTLLIRTAAAFVKNSTLCVDAGATAESAKLAASAVSGVKNSRIAVRLPVSPIQMEYVYHKKPKKMLELAKELFEAVKGSSESIELYAEDATRAEASFLRDIINLAMEYGVNTVTLCDDEGSMLPDEFSEFINKIRTEIPVLDKINMGVVCRNTSGMASASAIMAIKAGAGEIKCCVGGDDTVLVVIRNAEQGKEMCEKIRQMLHAM
jgi:2-isopropylmalate synthase